MKDATIRGSSKNNIFYEGDVVLDTFMGSGTTAVACKNIKRHFLGSEKNKDYYDIITKRLSQKNINFFEEGITCQSR